MGCPVTFGLQVLTNNLEHMLQTTVTLRSHKSYLLSLYPMCVFAKSTNTVASQTVNMGL